MNTILEAENTTCNFTLTYTVFDALWWKIEMGDRSFPGSSYKELLTIAGNIAKEYNKKGNTTDSIHIELSLHDCKILHEYFNYIEELEFADIIKNAIEYRTSHADREKQKAELEYKKDAIQTQTSIGGNYGF